MVTAVFHAHGTRLRALANDSLVDFEYRWHARQEMRNDSITALDVQSVLRTGAVVLVEQANFEETWRVRGTDLDGRTIEVLVVAYEKERRIKIISTWSV